MKYNTTYSPKGKIKETLIHIDSIKNAIKNYYKKNYKLIEVNAPIHDLETSDLLLNDNFYSRHITFDFNQDYRVGKLFLTHSNWLHNLIYKSELDIKEGFITNNTYLLRDVKEDALSSAEKNELTIQVLIDTDKTKEIVEKSIFNLYKLIMQILKKINPDLSTFFDSDIELISSQNLYNIMPDMEPTEREEKWLLDRNSFILKNPGKKLFNGQVHSYVSPSSYDMNNHYNLFLKSSVVGLPANIASASLMSSGQELSDQLKVYKEAKLLELKHFLKLSKSNKKVLEIKINIPLLAMIILGKGHIAEVQGGVTNKEAKHIKEMYKIKAI